MSGPDSWSLWRIANGVLILRKAGAFHQQRQTQNNILPSGVPVSEDLS